MTTAEAARDDALIYTGRRGAAFNITFFGTILTFLTLGIYRFWLKTRLRKYHWGAIQVGGAPLEFTGRGLELLIGALVAIVFLGVYFGAAYVLLQFLGYNFADPAIAVQAGPLLALLGLPLAPLWPWAAYRSQRYLLSRLNWRGVRFGLERGSATYAGLAILWFFGQALTLGLLTPVADYRKRKFIADRTRFGDLEFRMEGGPGRLYRSFMLPWVLMLFAFTLYVYVFGFVLADMTEGEVEAALSAGELPIALIAAPPIALLFGLIGFVWYASCRSAYFLRSTRIGDVGFASTLSGGRLFWITIGGSLMIFAATLAMVVLIIVAVVYAGDPIFMLGLGPRFGPALAIFVLLGFLFVAFLAAAVEAVIFTPQLRAAVRSSTIGDITKLEAAKQRAASEESGAEGFADALDVGAF